MKGYGLRNGNALDKRLYEIWRKMHDGKRRQITKCGFFTEEEAIIAATQYIKDNFLPTNSPRK